MHFNNLTCSSWELLKTGMQNSKDTEATDVRHWGGCLCKCSRYRAICLWDLSVLITKSHQKKKRAGWQSEHPPHASAAPVHIQSQYVHTCCPLIVCMSVSQAAKWPWADRVLHVHLCDADKQESLRGRLDCTAISWVMFCFFLCAVQPK